MKKSRKKRLAIFISGRGSNMENIVRAARRGRLEAEPALVFSDNPAAEGIKKAARLGVETAFLERSSFESKELYERAIVGLLKAKGIDFIALAGFMRIVGTVLLEAYPGKVLNIHPALLPSFKGAHAIRDAFEYGVRVTGVTVHFVDAQVDHGPIVLQKAIPLAPGTRFSALEKNIHAAEYELYPEAINLFASGRLKLTERGVQILPKR